MERLTAVPRYLDGVSRMHLRIFESETKSILSPVSGFLREAGFTHSLNPARNCTFGCSYCYVPTMRIQAGLRPEDWRHWGQWTTVKRNAAELLSKELRAEQAIYCSPLTDPYQPAEVEARLMPDLLEVVRQRVGEIVFVIQTRGPLVLRDARLLPGVRIGFSVTTNREDVCRIFEPHCAPIEERWAAIRRLRDLGIPVFATLAPILPCDPVELVQRAMEETSAAIIVDPFHVRATKRAGATTRQAALAICERHGWREWVDPQFQGEVLERMRNEVVARGRKFGVGPSGFGMLASREAMV